MDVLDDFVSQSWMTLECEIKMKYNAGGILHADLCRILQLGCEFA
jgi:hypothetical protein